MEKLIEKEKNMIIDGHVKGSSASHNREKRNAREIGRNRMSDEEFDTKIFEMKEHIDMLMKFLQENMKDHRYGWKLSMRREFTIVNLNKD